MMEVQFALIIPALLVIIGVLVRIDNVLFRGGKIAL